MADKTGIAWTDATWNPTTGCDRVSPGCANCYALTRAEDLKTAAIARAHAKGVEPDPTTAYMRDGDPKTSGPGFGLMLHENRLDQPLRWRTPKRIFVNSMSDLFHPEVPDEFLDEVFAVMALATQHQFQVLTKRPERMREYITAKWGDGYSEPQYDRGDRVWTAMTGRMTDAQTNDPEIAVSFQWPLPNVWLGTSVENARWRTRIDELRKTPAAIRFLSCEPLIGSLTDWTKAEVKTAELGRTFFDLTGIDWVIVGGESGPGSRPMDEQWVRDIVASCRAQGAKPFVKQMGEVWSMEHLGRHGHAEKPEEWAADLRIREYPDE